MQDRFKFRIIIEKDFKTINGKHKGQIIYYCNGFIQTKLKTYFFGNNKKLSFLNSQVKSINQCTGLKDKNGKLIYEGDILKTKEHNLCKEGELFKVFYQETLCQFLGKSLTTDNCIDLCDLYEEEVIGNIYENKELLNKSEVEE